MEVSRSSPRPRLCGLLLVIGVLAAAGCEDLTGPSAAAPALAALPLPIPTLLSTTEGLEASPGLARARTLWTDSWAGTAQDPEGLRAEARSLAAPLARAATDAALLDRERGALRRAATEVRSLVGPAGGLEPMLRGVEERLGASEGLEGAPALRALLEGSDQLLAVPLATLAEGLLECSQRRVRRNLPADAYSEVWQTRALHLQEGAREALDEGNLLVAVRRAYYGCRLLADHQEDDGPGPR
ncbi:MAG: hypothetical protein R3E10_03620 [Gemmatimonadota bacterium]